MLHFHAIRFGWILGLTLGSWTVTARAQEFRYHYVSLDQVALPPGFTSFAPSIIQDSGRVYGIVRNDSGDDNHIAFYENGTLTVRQPADSFLMTTGNAGGTFGGSVGPPGDMHAALFVGDEVVPILPLQGEVFAFVTALNDPGTALVESLDDSGHATYELYQHGQVSTLNFGTSVVNPVFFTRRVMNNNGIIAGTEGTDRFVDGRGFRFDLRTGEVALLQPLPGDTLSFGLGINARGDVLGYSFILPTSGVPYHENIGVWDSKGNFTTYVTEGISSDLLLFNDNNLIVITLVRSTRTSYLVPEPGVRLDLAALVDNLPAGQDLFLIRAMNNHGDMIGASSSGNRFLLERIPAIGR